MERQQVLEVLEEQLKKLQMEHVADLMKAKRSEELKDLYQDLNLDSSAISSWLKEKESLELKIEEIPKEFAYELASYICFSGYLDWQIFDDYNDFIVLLKEIGDETADLIAINMENNHISSYTIEELLS